jgi:hypothetical protein
MMSRFAQFVLSSTLTCGLLCLVASSPATAAEDKHRVTESPDGWTTSAPRDELRPTFSYEGRGGRDGKGCFVIAADQRKGLDGWWMKTVSVKGGTHAGLRA